MTLDFYAAPELERVRAVYLIFERGGASVIFASPQWRAFFTELQMAMVYVTNYGVQTFLPEDGRGQTILDGLRVLAGRADRPDLEFAPLVVWGHSRSSLWSTNMAGTFPDRVLGFIVYHMRNTTAPTGLDTTSVDAVRTMPALILGGERDTTVPNAVEETLAQLRQGRALDAPWTGGIEPGRPHGGGAGSMYFLEPNIIQPWIRALVEYRLPPGTEPYAAVPLLRPVVVQGRGWLGDLRDFMIAPNQSPGSIDRQQASWMIDEKVAGAWGRWFGSDPDREDPPALDEGGAPPVVDPVLDAGTAGISDAAVIGSDHDGGTLATGCARRAECGASSASSVVPARAGRASGCAAAPSSTADGLFFIVVALGVWSRRRR